VQAKQLLLQLKQSPEIESLYWPEEQGVLTGFGQEPFEFGQLLAKMHDKHTTVGGFVQTDKLHVLQKKP